jgi:hypothetical protein
VKRLGIVPGLADLRMDVSFAKYIAGTRHSASGPKLAIRRRSCQLPLVAQNGHRAKLLKSPLRQPENQAQMSDFVSFFGRNWPASDSSMLG